MKYNVTWISAFTRPLMFTEVSENEMKKLKEQGKNEQYRVYVEEINEEDLYINTNHV